MRSVLTQRPNSTPRAGLTLMELVVVLSVLVVLAAFSIPKLVDFVDRSKSATQAYSTADVNRQLEMYYAMNSKYPDGWDTLIKSDLSGLYAKLSPTLTATGGYLTTVSLTDDQLASVSAAGIHHAFLHDTASAPSDGGTDRRHFGSGTGHDGTANVNTFAVVNKDSGSKGLDLLINGFGLNPNKSQGDTTLARINANTYLVLGLGPKCSIVQTQINEAPLLHSATTAAAYARALAVFEVPNTGGGKAELVGIM